jgi:hypothetical protein
LGGLATDNRRILVGGSRPPALRSNVGIEDSFDTSRLPLM